MILVCALVAACSGRPREPLEFEDGWVRQAPPGSTMTAGFGRLVNRSAESLVVNSWSSPDYDHVSLHRTLSEGGISRMKSVPELTIEAGDERLLEPGGYHLMLMQPARPLTGTDEVEITAGIADGRSVVFVVPVEAR